MKKTMTAWETFRSFCSAWFERRCAEEVCTYLGDEFCFVGTGEDEFAHSPQEMREYLVRDIQEIPEPFSVELELFQEQIIDEDTRNLSVGMILKNTQYRWRLRGFFTLVRCLGDWRLRTLWFSEPSSSQRGEEHYPQTLVMETLVQQRQELLNDSLPGGMMGGYIEDGFPFYFVNNRMLKYLGYASEAEFVADIAGMVSNCMHPDDRALVDGEVTRQIAERGEYIVEYRMKKQDGSYIWVHDLGREVTAENGRPAIISVCIDITEQKKAQAEIMHLYNNIPGAVFRVKYDDCFSVADANDGLYELLGYTREEFRALGNQMAAVIYPGDLNAVRDKLLANECCGNTIRNEHRLLCKDGSIKWISLKAQVMPGDDGEPYFYGFLVDITDEKLAQELVRELYEKELAYFAQAAPQREVSRAESMSHKAGLRVTNLRPTVPSRRWEIPMSRPFKDWQLLRQILSTGNHLRTALDKEQVLTDFASGKTELHFEFLRRRNEGGSFLEQDKFQISSKSREWRCDRLLLYHRYHRTKIQEQLLRKVTKLDYELISDIDIRHDTYRVVSFHPGTETMMPAKGRFQAEAREIAATSMDAAAGEEYLAKLDFTFMQRELAEHGSYNFIAEVKG